MVKGNPLIISTSQLMEYLYLISESYPDGTVLKVTESDIIVYDLDLNFLTTVRTLLDSEIGLIN